MTKNSHVSIASLCIDSVDIILQWSEDNPIEIYKEDEVILVIEATPDVNLWNRDDDIAVVIGFDVLPVVDVVFTCCCCF